MQCLVSFFLPLFRRSAAEQAEGTLLPPLPDSEYDWLETDTPSYQSARPLSNSFFSRNPRVRAG